MLTAHGSPSPPGRRSGGHISIYTSFGVFLFKDSPTRKIICNLCGTHGTKERLPPCQAYNDGSVYAEANMMEMNKKKAGTQTIRSPILSPRRVAAGSGREGESVGKKYT